MDPGSLNQGTAANTSIGLVRIERLLGTDPFQAEQQAAEFLVAKPGHPMALLYLAIARRLLRKPGAAIEILTPLASRHPNAPLVQLHLGLAQRESGRNHEAVESLRRAVSIKQDFTDAWLALADLLTAMHDKEAAAKAFLSYADHSTNDPRLLEPAVALREQRYAEAESLLRGLLQNQPNDIVALCMLSEVIECQGRTHESEDLLIRCLNLAPGYRRARHNYTVLLLRHNKVMDAMQEIDRLLAESPGNPDYLKLRAALHINLREHHESINIYQALLDQFPLQPDVWTSLGHALKSVGRRADCMKAYRKAIAVEPGYGEAYWAIANVKTEHFTEAEVAAMLDQVNSPAIGTEDRIKFHFALGKALEDGHDYAQSFRHYDEGNRLRYKTIRYNREEFSAYVQRCKRFFTDAFFAERPGCGGDYADPIFIVGLPRSGTTLVEQILSSHSCVEGTTELPEIIAMAKTLAAWKAGSDSQEYPEVLTRMERGLFRELGTAYINQTRIHRKHNRPMFIDKMPENFAHIGLIHLILPNARIIDVRRHPLASGFSIYKQYFARGQEFSYSLEDIGSYYRNYVELMAHFNKVLPGRVYRIIYESLVQDTENEVRRLLQHCNLPYESACLEFYSNDRAVTTPSSEQVRSPIYRDAMNNWVPYASWLGPLQASVGDLIDEYPNISASLKMDEHAAD
ncbi:MAG: sulfotransferase family protein [Gammaproteobacteria bacterium]|nr:sulfotransferase family protein [Gammaproteobacteria bacterium]